MADREELGTQSGAIVDYGSLMYIALQRSKTAREAIESDDRIGCRIWLCQFRRIVFRF